MSVEEKNNFLNPTKGKWLCFWMLGCYTPDTCSFTQLLKERWWSLWSTTGTRTENPPTRSPEKVWRQYSLSGINPESHNHCMMEVKNILWGIMNVNQKYKANIWFQLSGTFLLLSRSTIKIIDAPQERSASALTRASWAVRGSVFSTLLYLNIYSVYCRYGTMRPGNVAEIHLN